jgi:membrane-bound lytic murein transglycosylase D
MKFPGNIQNWRSMLLLAFLIISLFEGFLLLEKNQGSKSDQDYTKAYQQNNKIFSLILPSKLDFSGEKVPMNLYYVREGLDRELTVNTYWQSSTLMLLKKANRYFPIMEPILAKYKVPDDFKYLALIESGLTNVVSPAGASGYWQFIAETGKKYGLEITDEVDERYNLEKSTEAACKYLLHSHNLLGSWTLSAAAYNAGESRIQKEVSEQKTGNYYDLYLNTETSRYLFRILALKMLYEHPTEFGYFLRNKDLYPPIPSYTVSLDTSVSNLVSLAKKLSVNYRVFKDFNPWLRKDKLTLKPGKKYILTIPQKGFEEYDHLLPGQDKAELIFNDTLTAGKLFKY